MPPTFAVEATGLVKTYPGGRGRPPVQALDGLDLAVPAGTVHGLLGPNGAGKTTTTKVLTTLSTPTAGSAIVAGHDVSREADAVRRAIGYVSQGTGGRRPLHVKHRGRRRSRSRRWASTAW